MGGVFLLAPFPLLLASRFNLLQPGFSLLRLFWPRLRHLQPFPINVNFFVLHQPSTYPNTSALLCFFLSWHLLFSPIVSPHKEILLCSQSCILPWALSKSSSPSWCSVGFLCILLPFNVCVWFVLFFTVLCASGYILEGAATILKLVSFFHVSCHYQALLSPSCRGCP